MADSKENGWLPMGSAKRDGQRILVTVRGGEQGAAEVDTVRFQTVRGSSERCWVATDMGPDGLVAYDEDELVAWMPWPEPTERTAGAIFPAPANEVDFEEAGSGI
ncbi:hypothetical protein LQ948_14270 [Jiella sp. MQZ9-1]|uniref:Uncharacterized protein n=1 Tax=Jiella flava TaxID=2816857 RepID=A0A939JV41_9HYPH|nr:hypothetical protein [Jiella flava]MBO0663800.1 hypothetical protein [Jiella flava]MCD2472373.1 hypothetical protein [Jiella flava]